MNKQLLKSDIDKRLRAIFSAYAEGKDVSPAELFRTEGMMAAAMIVGACDEASLKALLAQRQQEILGSVTPIPEGGTLQVPSRMAIAPVRS